MAFELPKLAYSFDALEPHLDARTMEIHYGKHHLAYTNNFNAALEKEGLVGKPIEEIFANVSKYQAAVMNHGGGYYNHNLYWENLTPNGGGQPEGDVLQAINRDFGSFDQFKVKFSQAAATQFGSGWAWLCLDKNDKLCVCSTSNQVNPLMDVAACPGKPLLTIDVWEHAYYLQYQNRRPEFIDAFWNVINWEVVAKRLKG